MIGLPLEQCVKARRLIIRFFQLYTTKLWETPYAQASNQFRHSSKIRNWLADNERNLNVNKPVVLDNKLTIDAGAKIQFSESSYLIVKGSIKAEGTEGSVIELRPIKSSWKGIYIYNATDKSYMKNTTISGTTGITDGVLNLTGGMTFYRSNIFMDKCSFINSEAEDALNIVESKFEINDVIVSEVASDGIDFDFSDGLVTNSQFYKISGDALDFSGSVSKITNCKIVGVRDKAISIGEKSTVEVARCQITNVSVGVAAKDGSHNT